MLDIICSRLDTLIAQAVSRAEEVFGSANHYHGVVVSLEEVQNLLELEPGYPILYDSSFKALSSFSTEDSKLNELVEKLKTKFSLSAFELDVIFLCLALEIDLKYQRLIAYLNDDMTKKHPTVNLCLNLLSQSKEDRLRNRKYFSKTSNLFQSGIIKFQESQDSEQLLLAKSIVINEAISNLFLDPELGYKEVRQASPIKAQHSAIESLYFRDIIFISHLFGGDPSIRQRYAQSIANHFRKPIFSIQASDIIKSNLLNYDALQSILLEVELNDLFIHFSEFDPSHRLIIAEQCRSYFSKDFKGAVIFTSAKRTDLIENAYPIEISDLTQEEKVQEWQTALQKYDLIASYDQLTLLVNRFELNVIEIHQAANQLYLSQLGQVRDLSNEALYAVARQIRGLSLNKLAEEIIPGRTMADLCLPSHVKQQLMTLIQRVNNRHQVLFDWKFSEKFSYGTATVALFSGPSGTGKTMAAEVIAGELGVRIYKINLANVVNKFVGETEKNLERIFTAAEQANAILFFDEADAVLGKRSSVKDAHDRYANIETSYLLQRIERYNSKRAGLGFVILSTNLIQNMDDAFTRRISNIIHFPFPESDIREELWQSVWSGGVQLSPNIDLKVLAHSYKLSGGAIKNIALNAAFQLADHDSKIVNEDVLAKALKDEFIKLGKTLNSSEINFTHNGHHKQNGVYR